MHKNVTIRLSEEAAHWARRKAADENTSVSRLVGAMLEREMRLSDEYWRAVERRKGNWPVANFSAAQRATRAEIHDRANRG